MVYGFTRINYLVDVIVHVARTFEKSTGLSLVHLDQVLVTHLVFAFFIQVVEAGVALVLVLEVRFGVGGLVVVGVYLGAKGFQHAVTFES